MNRRKFITHSAAISTALGATQLFSATGLKPSMPAQAPVKRIPVIYDTDIGGDIDDTWALHMLLRCPEVDIKLIATDADNCTYKTRLLAKLLDYGGYHHLPIAMGIQKGDAPDAQSGWLGQYQLEDYPGTIHADAADAIIETIHNSPEPVTIICVGPLPNIGEALKRDPSITKNARFVGMYGAIYEGYEGAKELSAEWNVQQSIESLRAVFAADWECTITPIDSCQHVVLRDERYLEVRRSHDHLMKDLMANYDHWIRDVKWLKTSINTEKESSILYDTVAVHLAYSEDWLKMETLPLIIDDDGYTRIDQENGHPIRCAVGWSDQNAFEEDLVRRLTGA